MNPYKNIDSKVGIEIDKESEFYGQYRLEAKKISPVYFQSICILKVKYSEELQKIFDSFDSKGFLHLYDEVTPEFRSLGIEISGDEGILAIDAWSEVTHIGSENIYFMISKIAKFIEDSHFIIFSSGDQDDRWIDEYKIEGGELGLERHNLEEEIYHGQYKWYEKIAEERKDQVFTRFVIRQFLEQIMFLIENPEEYGDVLDEQDVEDVKNYLERSNKLSELLKPS